MAGTPTASAARASDFAVVTWIRPQSVGLGYSKAAARLTDRPPLPPACRS